MALLGSKKNKKEEVAKPKSGAASYQRRKLIASQVLKAPRVTEKAAINSEKHVYTFVVATRSNKKQIAAAIKELYGVTPIKVNITALPLKNVIVRGKKGVKGGGKKAQVYLKKGDKIDLV